jgi:LemA protein
MQFNTRIESFPSNLVAGMFQFAREAFFEIELAPEREAPSVKF